MRHQKKGRKFNRTASPEIAKRATDIKSDSAGILIETSFVVPISYSLFLI